MLPPYRGAKSKNGHVCLPSRGEVKYLSDLRICFPLCVLQIST